ncbi:MAG: hypothetical protein ACOWWH_09195 [Eubacteriaceae bacterium]
MKKFYFILFISYIFFFLEFPVNGLSVSMSVLLIMFKSMHQSFFVMFLLLIFLNVVVFVSHLIQSLYYYSKGYGMTPVLFYPIIFMPAEKRKIKIFKNFLFTGECIYPKKLYEQMQQKYDDKIASSLCQTAHLYGFVSEIIFCGLVILLSLWKEQYLLSIGIGLIAVAFIAVAYEISYTYHGLMSRRNNMQKGNAVFYLTKQLIIYNNESHDLYYKFLKRIEEEKEGKFELFIIETIKHMYMIRCLNPDFSHGVDTDTIYSNNYFVKSMSEITLSGTGDEKLSFMKVYMCHAMICKDLSALNFVLHYLNKLHIEMDNNLLFKEDVFIWYIKIGSEYKIESQKSKLYKNKILRPNDFYSRFENYKYNYEIITEKIKYMCKEVDERC